MATRTASGPGGYPLMAYNFRVTVGGRTMSFSKVSGLQRAYETVTYRHGLSAWEGESIASYRVDTYQTITLERGTLALGDRFLFHWLERQSAESMTVSLCDARASAVLTWKVHKAIPIKLSAPTFSADTSDVSIDTFEVMGSGITLTV